MIHLNGTKMIGNKVLILAVIGLVIGLILPSAFDVFPNLDSSEMISNPSGYLTSYVTGFASGAIIETISGLIGAIILGFVGLMIDLIDEPNYSY